MKETGKIPLDKTKFFWYTCSMKKTTLTYDKEGLGIAELVYLALNYPIIHSLVSLLISYNLGKLAIKLTRMVV